MPSIGALADLIARTGIPVLFLDTCNFLDIIRLAISERFRPGEAQAAKELSNLISASPPSCLLVASSIINREWNDNLPNVRKAATDHLAGLERESGHFHEACETLGIAGRAGRTGYSSSGLTETLCELSKKLFDNAVHLDADRESRVRATFRVEEKRPPALESKEIKDCIVIEEYLAVCEALRSGGYSGKLVFCTTNKKDYCIGSALDGQLAKEFGEVGLKFAKNLQHALHEMTH